MKGSDETAVLDPAEFISGRDELPLDLIGIQVRDADWSDAEHEVFMIKQAIGEIPADKHPPNRKVTLKLKAKTIPTKVTLAEALYRLQQKVGTLQEKGGWIRRDMNTDHGFKASVGAQVFSAVLGGVQGWYMSHREVAPEITLVLTIGPYFYAADEVEEGKVEDKTGTAREIIFTDTNKKGSAKGLRRVRIENLNSIATENWLGLIFAEECETAPDNLADPTAELAYPAQALTLKGGSVAKTVSSVPVVENAKLTPSWLTVIDSKIIASGYMTHKGPRRMLMRAYQVDAELGYAEMRLRWRALGASRWNEDNDIVTFPVLDAYQILDLGEARPEAAVLGDERWEWQVQARHKGGSGTIRMHRFWPLPTEQFIVVTDTPQPESGAPLLWEDNFEQTSGNVTGKTAPVGGVYEGFGTAADLKVNQAEKLLESP